MQKYPWFDDRGEKQLKNMKNKEFVDGYFNLIFMKFILKLGISAKRFFKDSDEMRT